MIQILSLRKRLNLNFKESLKKKLTTAISEQKSSAHIVHSKRF